MFEKPDGHAETFAERRALAASEEGRKALLMDFIAVLHGKVMDGEMTDSNMLRAIQTAEKLHRTLADPALAPQTQQQPKDDEEDPYAYDHTNMHRKLAEMSDEDLISHVEGLVGAVEHKHRPRNLRQALKFRTYPGPFSRFGETVPAPAKGHKR